MPNITIAYGSESGNAKRLATTLAETLKKQGYAPAQLDELNAISLTNLNENDTLIIITSSFGDGEPTGNSNEFHEHLLESKSIDCQFAVFGLGDVSYPKFCGFSIEIDTLLRQRGGKAIAKRVDADTAFKAFFDQWVDGIISHFSGDSRSLGLLNLQVKAYSKNQSFPARIQSVKRVNSGDFPVYDIQIGVAGGGLNYQAGDLLYVVPPANEKTLARIAEFYGEFTDNQYLELGKKELRHLGKPLFRAFAKLTKNDELKALTKMSASKKLAEYCYGRDVADVLVDFCTREIIPFTSLLDILSVQLPRAYSIASCGSASPDTVRLCVREVAYQRGGILYDGTASHFLVNCAVGEVVNVYVRDNPHFHLPSNDRVPIVLIGAGVGIAPHLGFLASERQGEIHLFFGERHRDHDYLYKEELEQQYLDSGRLSSLHTAFSRDQAEKIYVQTIIREQGREIWKLLQQSGEIYVCGSKANLAKPLDSAFCEIAQIYGELSEDDSKQWLYDLVSAGRYHQDLY